MKYSLFTIILTTIVTSISYGQFHDNSWYLGYDGTLDSMNHFGVSTLNFNLQPVRVSFSDSNNFDFYVSSTTLSSNKGDLQFYTNGLEINNSKHKTLHNSDTFNAYYRHDSWYGLGLPLSQGVVALPMGSDSVWLIHAKSDAGEINGDFTGFAGGISYSLIDMNMDGGLGRIVIKDQIIVQDTISQGGILLNVKHTNGRDWWTISPKLNSNEYIRILTNDQGPQLMENQIVGDPVGNGLIQAAFSPDGKYYARNTVSNDRDELDLYQFDRSTGLLSDHEQLYYDGNANWGGGVVFSPNSRFLYVIGSEKIFQFDLRIENWQETKRVVAIYDGFTEFIPNANVPIHFFLAWNGPDGKIYICSSAATSYLHTIHYPNEKGIDCQVEQHSIKLGGYHNRTVPNHPNYRLGPIDGSVADTLGIDNVPLCGWRYEILEAGEVRFTDNSWYEPATWSWSFGDGAMSADTSPYHTYQDTGRYDVCLIISNVNGCDTFCREVVIRDSLVAARNILLNQTFSIYPNPARDYLFLETDRDLGEVDILFYDVRGRLVEKFERDIYSDRQLRLDVSGFVDGVYLMEFRYGGEVVLTRKVVVY